MADYQQVAAAMQRIRRKFCSTQVYEFDDYEVDSDLGFGDPTAVCQRLGIPVTDELFLDYPAERSFVPLADELINELETAMEATLPVDYRWLLRSYGPCHLPGRSHVRFYSPTSAVGATLGAWWHDGEPRTAPVLAIATYHATADGNALGFLRDGNSFSPEVYELDHDLRWTDPDPKHWTHKRADSLGEFLLNYIKSLE